MAGALPEEKKMEEMKELQLVWAERLLASVTRAGGSRQVVAAAASALWRLGTGAAEYAGDGLHHRVEALRDSVVVARCLQEHGFAHHSLGVAVSQARAAGALPGAAGLAARRVVRRANWARHAAFDSSTTERAVGDEQHGEGVDDAVVQGSAAGSDVVGPAEQPQGAQAVVQGLDGEFVLGAVRPAAKRQEQASMLQQQQERAEGLAQQACDGLRCIGPWRQGFGPCEGCRMRRSRFSANATSEVSSVLTDDLDHLRVAVLEEANQYQSAELKEDFADTGGRSKKGAG